MVAKTPTSDVAINGKLFLFEEIAKSERSSKKMHYDAIEKKIYAIKSDDLYSAVNSCSGQPC